MIVTGEETLTMRVMRVVANSFERRETARVIATGEMTMRVIANSCDRREKTRVIATGYTTTRVIANSSDSDGGDDE
jgi:hypothetical protein